MRELITQNINHPSVACWGLSNEITAASPVSEDLLENHRELNALCHELDGSRPTVMANVFMLETDSPLLGIPDANCYNLYFGWYLGELGENDAFFDEWRRRYPDRPIGLSEYGADANVRFQTDNPGRGDYSEGYQCVYHEHMLRMIEARPWLWSTFVWNMFDFAADGRDEGGRPGVNQKGLVSFDRSYKKDAFYLYKAHWSGDPFVHVCGRRYIDRTGDTTQVKVYSSLPVVELLLDGVPLDRKEGSRVFTFSVPLTGEHTVTARSGEFSDTITVRKVDEPNLSYRLNKQGGVTNWFDDSRNDPACYSLSDTLGDLQASPEAGALVQKLMAGMAASRGDLADRVMRDNPALQRMMMRQTLSSMLRHAGDAVSKEQAGALNAALQKIRKPV